MLRISMGSPYDLVFLAMTRFQRGEQKQAADLLKKSDPSLITQSRETQNWTPSLRKPGL